MRHRLQLFPRPIRRRTYGRATRPATYNLDVEMINRRQRFPYRGRLKIPSAQGFSARHSVGMCKCALPNFPYSGSSKVRKGTHQQGVTRPTEADPLAKDRPDPCTALTAPTAGAKIFTKSRSVNLLHSDKYFNLYVLI